MSAERTSVEPRSPVGQLPAYMEPAQIDCMTDRMKFHWDVWVYEDKSFWRRVTATSLTILLVSFYQLQIITLSPEWMKVKDATQCPGFFHIILFLICLFMLALTVFSFVDLMRHRVPDAMEPYVHNNFLPPKPKQDPRQRKTGVEAGVELLHGLSTRRVELPPGTTDVDRGRDLRTLGRRLYDVVFFGYLMIFGALATLSFIRVMGWVKI